MIVTEKCIECRKCLDICCIALHENRDGSIVVNSDLCSGCGWGKVICPVEAFTRDNIKSDSQN